jgi:hypothetical protein
LKSLGHNNFRECFGGVFYFFLRGMANDAGVWFVPGKTLLAVDELEKEVAKRLARHVWKDTA